MTSLSLVASKFTTCTETNTTLHSFFSAKTQSGELQPISGAPSNMASLCDCGELPRDSITESQQFQGKTSPQTHRGSIREFFTEHCVAEPAAKKCKTEPVESTTLCDVDPSCCQQCPKCQQMFPVWLFEEHSDYHFALELQAAEGTSSSKAPSSRKKEADIQTFLVRKES